MKNLFVILFLLTFFLIILSCSEDSNKPSDDNGSNVETVTICDQVWMAKNLDVTHYRNGDPIHQVTDPDEWANLTTGAWCYYDNDPANGKIYGKLYNWYAVNDPRGLAPEGWHIPSDEEWKQLEMCLGMSQEDADEEGGDRGTNEASKLAGDYDLWQEGDLRNSSEFDSSGFTARPGGYRNYTTGDFDYIGYNVAWWSSTDFSSSDAIYRILYYGRSDVGMYHLNKRNGFSVRCVRD